MPVEISVLFYQEGRYWVAQALDVDVSSFGETLDGARASIREALELYFDSPDQVQLDRVTKTSEPS